MSQCATLADDTLDQQKEIGPEITVRDVVEFILEEAVFAAVFFSDKDCSRIGDFNIGTDFRQSFDQVPAYSKEFGMTKLNPRQNGSEGGGGGGGNATFKLESGESIDRSISLLTARENLELILDSLMKKEEKVKNLNDCKIISENLLADGELRIENGQIRFGDENKKNDGNRETSYWQKQESDVGKIQMESLMRGNVSPDDFSFASIIETKSGDDEEKETKTFRSDLEMRPTEDFRQVFSEPNTDPNRPRAYAIAEEDVRKMAEEMEKINGSVRRTIREKESDVKEEIPSSAATSAFAFDNDSASNGHPQAKSSDLVEKKPAPFSQSDHVPEDEFSIPGDLKDHLLFRDPESFVDTNALISETNHHIGNRFNPKTQIALSSVDDENFVHDEFRPVDSSGESFVPKCVDGISASLETGFIDEAKPRNENPNGIPTMAEKNANWPEPAATNDVDPVGLPVNEGTSKVDEKAPTEMRETEMAVSDSRLGTEKKIANLKPCQSAFSVTETSRSKFGSDYFPRTKSENSKDGFFSVENKMETFSGTFKHSNSFMEEVPERILENSVDIEHPQSNLSAGKSETNFSVLAKEDDEKFENLLLKIDKESDDLKFFPIAPTTLPEEKSFEEAEKIEVLEENDDCKSLKDESESKIIMRENNEDGYEKLNRVSSHSHFSDFISHPEPSPETNTGEKKILTEASNSQENFISQVENVIQIIDPADGQSDDEGGVSFSFPEEFEGKESREIAGSEKEAHFSSVVSNDPGKRVRSGMTTIGPMKSVDHDPKDLTSNVDFGKMTRINSSGKEAMEDDLSLSDIPSSTSLKIVEDSDESRSADPSGGEPIRVGSFVNRDIASLTKVQKIREVMSYHPKPEDDFEDDNNLNRLDLKDVESMTDERYKLQDVSVPLLSFDVRDTDSRGSKDLIQNLNLVLSGNCFANGNFYFTDDAGAAAAAAETSTGGTEETSFSGGATKGGSVKDEADGPTRKVTEMDAEDVVVIEANEDESKSDVGLRSPENDFSQHRLKHQTLGSVFRKASNKLIRKEDEGFHLRNTRSLPRDASKMMAAESIKSILEDCHSSAANVLKKSQSFLKSTQSLFKTISQSGFGGSSTNESNERRFPPGPDGSPANSETKIQTFLRKEDLAKAKNAIMKKIEKTFKTADDSVKNRSESPVSNSNLEAVNQKKKNESARFKESNDNDEGDRENVKSKNFSSPKSPLVYKSQFVKSKIRISSEFSENNDLNSISFFANNGKTLNGRPVSDQTIKKEREDLEPNGKSEKRIKAHRETLVSGSEEKGEKGKCNEVPDYIVMETVEGLPAPDLETSCYLVEVEISESPDAVSIENDQYFGTLKSPSLEDGKPVKKDDVPGEVHVGSRATENPFPSVDVDKCKLGENVDESDKKCSRNKSKKLSSRFKNFWSSAFGKVKRPPIKGASLERTHE